MDIPTILVIFVAGLLAIGLTAYMLNRAWGDFPSRAGRLDPGPPPAPPSTTPAWATAPAEAEDGAGDDEAGLPAGAPDDGLIPITHPLVRRAIESALERGGTPYATYFVRDGERLFLAAHRIADPVQRAQFVRVFRDLSGDAPSGASLDEILGVVRQFTKRP